MASKMIENVFVSTNSLQRLSSFNDRFEESPFPFLKIFSESYDHEPENKQITLRDVIYQGSLIDANSLMYMSTTEANAPFYFVGKI